MATLKRTRNILLTSAVTAAAVGLGASLALASAGPAHHVVSATTWSISPGGTTSGVSGKVTITDTATASAITCKSSKGSGELKKGSGLSGTDIGEVATAPLFADCITQGAPGPWDWAWEPPGWNLTAVSYSAKGVTTGKVTGLHAAGTTTACSLVLDGTSGSGDNGELKGTYTNSTGKGTLLSSGGDLHFWDVSGCLGLFNNGDAAVVKGSFTVTPKQTVTRP
jgi:hypothetical protein